jgi:hypothetical protein
MITIFSIPFHPGDKILQTLWIGALWTLGFLVVPTLFATIDDRQLAGIVAGKLFTLVSYIGLFCALILIVSDINYSLLWKKSWLRSPRLIILLIMLVLIIVGEFIIQPQMAQLKQVGLAISNDFDRLHSIATVIYLLNCLLGLFLIMIESSMQSNN